MVAGSSALGALSHQGSVQLAGGVILVQASDMCMKKFPDDSHLQEFELTSASQPVHSEGDQPWDFFGRNDVKAETPVLWPPHAKS